MRVSIKIVIGVLLGAFLGSALVSIVEFTYRTGYDFTDEYLKAKQDEKKIACEGALRK